LVLPAEQFKQFRPPNSQRLRQSRLQSRSMDHVHVSNWCQLKRFEGMMDGFTTMQIARTATTTRSLWLAEPNASQSLALTTRWNRERLSFTAQFL
jgi:hypothetical protein